MKYIVSILAACVVFVACQSSDKKTTEPSLSQDEKDKASVDSANFTSIEWLDSTTADLGKIKEGQVVEVTYRFKNAGTKPLVISNVSASCGCTVPEKPEKPIAPGEEEKIKAKFDSRGKPGEQNKTITVVANTTPDNVHYLNFHVQVTAE